MSEAQPPYSTGPAPAPPSRDPLDPAGVLELLQTWARILLLISVEDAAALVAACDRQETLQPILDPTAYRAQAGNLRVAKHLAAAFLTFRQELEAIKQEVLRDGLT